MADEASITIIGSTVLIGIITGGLALAHYGTRDTVRNVHVSGKERIVESSGDTTSSKYLVFTNGETFENTDSLFALKFDSSDLHGRLREGMVCTFEVTGWRLPFFSSYRNILSATCGSATVSSGCDDA